MMNNVARFDRGSVKGDASMTEEGYIKANAIVTRTGILVYQNSDGSVRRELRHPTDVWNEDSLASMRMIPVTNGHPLEKLVNAENYKRLAIGFTGETVNKDGNYILSNFLITDKDGVEAVKVHGRKELSLGYTVDLVDEKGIYEGQEYDARQTNIRYNHLAIVDSARAGKEARIALDSNDAVQINNDEVNMSKKKIKIDQEEMMVDQPVAEYVDRLQDDLRNLTDEKMRVEERLRDAQDENRRVEEEIAMIRRKLEKAEAERDAVRSSDVVIDKDNKEKVASMDSADFKRAVDERVKLLKVAEAHLDHKEEKLSSLSNQEIKREVILKLNSSMKLDGKTETYVDAAFDTLLEVQAKSANVSNVKFNPNFNSDSKSDREASRQKMMERHKQAHLKK